MTGPRIDRLKKRPEFLAVAATQLRYATPGVVVQARPPESREDAPGPARFGFTATRKLGGAVVRNRARRRLKAAAALLATTHARPGFDYVFVARAGTIDRDWQALLRDVAQAMDRAPATHRPRR
jgi:ribonuclease P protein component